MTLETMCRYVLIQPAIPRLYTVVREVLPGVSTGFKNISGLQEMRA